VGTICLVLGQVNRHFSGDLDPDPKLIDKSLSHPAQPNGLAGRGLDNTACSLAVELFHSPTSSQNIAYHLDQIAIV